METRPPPEIDWDVPDAELVRRAQAGDTKAFERLYREHVRRVYALCYRLAADRDRAAGFTQDTFVRAWEKLDSFRGESAFISWLYRIAVNVSLAEFRSENRLRSRHRNAALEDGLDDGVQPMPVDAAIDLETCLQALPLQARTVLVLHDIQGFHHEEIGEQLGIAAGTSKAHLHRARTLLKKWLNR